MTEYRVEKTIGASPEAVWAILIDAPIYPEWNPAVERIEGVIAPGETIELTATVNPKRAFKLKVTEFAPATTMTWAGGMPLGMFTGVRTFSLDAQDDATTTFVMHETYRGWMAGLMTKSMPDLTESFEQFAAGLKAKVESGTG